jgi:uncharacterized protein YkwD
VALSVALAGAASFASAGMVFAWDASAFSSADEGLLFTLTNQDRASAGLNALVNDSYLHTKVEWRAQDMGDRGYFSHEIPPDNKMVFAYMQADGYCFNVAGENIATSSYGDSDATANIEVGFMGSPTHRANILGTWANMGVAAYKAADGTKFYAVLFSIPCSAAQPTPVPTPIATPVPTPVPTAPPDVPPKTTPAPPKTTPVPPTTTPVPIVTPVATPVATPTPEPTAVPTLTSTASPNPGTSPIAPFVTFAPNAGSAGGSVATPTPTPAGPVATPVPGVPSSLRVYEQPLPQGSTDSILSWLFGGLLGGLFGL